MASSRTRERGATLRISRWLTGARGRSGITITCRKLSANTRAKPRYVRTRVARGHGSAAARLDRDSGSRLCNHPRGSRRSNCNKLTALITPQPDHTFPGGAPTPTGHRAHDGRAIIDRCSRGREGDLSRVMLNEPSLVLPWDVNRAKIL